MKLYAVDYTGPENKPARFWTASIAEATTFIGGDEIEPQHRSGAAIRIVDLPAGRAAMARWLNAENVGGWQ